MKKHVVAPLVLLSSLTLLTSCMEKSTSVTPVAPQVETSTPSVEVVTEPATPVPVTPSPVEVTPMAPEAATLQTFTRTETVTYASPASPQDPVEFSVTVTDGVITAASVTPKSTNEISQKLQTAFGAEVASKAIGKSAKDLDLDVVAGASLTTAAFEQFVRSF